MAADRSQPDRQPSDEAVARLVRVLQQSGRFRVLGVVGQEPPPDLLDQLLGTQGAGDGSGPKRSPRMLGTDSEEPTQGA